VPKVTIPFADLLHFRGGRGAISKEAYPDMQGFYDDRGVLSRRDQIASAMRGHYLQLDDADLAYLAIRSCARARGSGRRPR
jgi:5-methyltetrahydropteroyltriglutamate--homocysteine methyltransferase